MRAVLTIARYQLGETMRSRWLIGYTLFFVATAAGLRRFGGGEAQALLSLMNVTLFVVPLVTLVFGTVYLYGAREFIELLLAQPVDRKRLYAGLYLGLAAPLALAFLLATGLPFALRPPAAPEERRALLVLLAAGTALGFVFCALAFVVAVQFADRLKGLGAAIALWLLLAFVYDAGVLVAATLLADHPLERPLLAAMLANPIDLARIVMLLQLDVAALLGYTGAVFRQFFGGSGLAIAAVALLGWIVAPIWIGMRGFMRRDF
jgi:Cu-processing system permease protein